MEVMPVGGMVNARAKLNEARSFLESQYSSVEAASLCGRVVGLEPHQLDHFCYSFAETMFVNHRIPDRIDWLYLQDKITPCSDPEICGRMDFGFHEDAFYVRDLSGMWSNLNLVLLRGTEGDIGSYSVRWFDNAFPWFPNDARLSLKEVVGRPLVKGNREYCHFIADDVYWNFRREGDWVKSIYRTDAYLNCRLTRLAVFFVKWTTNVLGFQAES